MVDHNSALFKEGTLADGKARSHSSEPGLRRVPLKASGDGTQGTDPDVRCTSQAPDVTALALPSSHLTVE
jgi:hypothetical protein